jgi:hypothetical protein
MFVNSVGIVQEAWHWTGAGPGRYRRPRKDAEKRPRKEAQPRPAHWVGLVVPEERVLAMEVEIVKRASAYFVRENPIVAHRHHAVAG